MPPSAGQIRKEFIDYFVRRAGHTFVPSSPVVPQDDPTLLFTNAGMNQFKDVFLGAGTRPYTRAVNSQKCIRAGGKHNDLEDVGKDTYHHTFFEMLGNWSFGDYFKREAIDWAWDLLVNVWKLDPQRLHATYFQGDEAEQLAPDHEARDLWLRHLPRERVHQGNKKDNFWEMGDTGPCGPCSEIHFDGTPGKDGAALVNAGDPRVIEIWNLVFIQFNRGTDATLTPLPARHVDTGMGFERITRIIQGKDSNYDTDIWTPIFHAIENRSGARPYRGKLDDPVDIAYRVIADHVRCLAVAITDGARPSNEGRGYVLRRILRRAVRMARQTLGVKGPMLFKLVPSVVQSLGEAFPELNKNPRHVADVIRDEEEAFLKTLDRGIEFWWLEAGLAIDHVIRGERLRRSLNRLRDLPKGPWVVKAGWGHPKHLAEEQVAQGYDFAPTLGALAATDEIVVFEGLGDDYCELYRGRLGDICASDVQRFFHVPTIAASGAFKLHDTYGFPIDLTRVMAEERGMSVDVEGFEQLMEQARATSRGGKPGDAGADEQLMLPPEAVARLKHMGVEPTDDLDKYHGRPIRAKVLAIWNGADFDERTDESHHVDGCAIILDRTNFYADAGGQIGDSGRIVDVDDDRSEFIVEGTSSFGAAGGHGRGYVLHIGRLLRGEISVGESVQLYLAGDRRDAIRANHTGTHLLNWALREMLAEGDEVNQKGSLVADDRLRFDFSHAHALTPQQIERVEALVNQRIRDDLAVHADVVPLATARQIAGVRAVFGERYPDPVRVVSIGAAVQDLVADPGNARWRQFSIEFCGGTHLAGTKQAKLLVIVSEQALASGVRRIIALTGPAAIAADIAGRDLQARAENLAHLSDDLVAGEFDQVARSADELPMGAVRRHRVHELIESVRPRIKSLRKGAQAASRDQALEQARRIVDRAAGRIIVEQIRGADKDSLLSALDVIKNKRADAAAMLFSADESEGKVVIVAAVPRTFIEAGLKAGDWVKQAAAMCGGGGGGRPDMAQAGGRDPARIPDAIAASRQFAEQKLGAASPGRAGGC